MTISEGRASAGHWSIAAQARYNRCTRPQADSDLEIISSLSATLQGFDDSLQTSSATTESAKARSWQKRFLGLAVRLVKTVQEHHTGLRSRAAQQIKTHLAKDSRKDYRRFLLAAKLMLILNFSVQASKLLLVSNRLSEKQCSTNAFWADLRYELTLALRPEGSEARLGLHDLPFEVVLLILKKILMADRLRCRLVCKQWAKLVDNSRLLFRSFKHHHESLSSRAVTRFRMAGDDGPESIHYTLRLEWPSPMEEFSLQILDDPRIVRRKWYNTKYLDLRVKIGISQEDGSSRNEDELLMTLDQLLPSFPNLEVLTVSLEYDKATLEESSERVFPESIKFSGNLAQHTPHLRSFSFEAILTIPGDGLNRLLGSRRRIDFGLLRLSENLRSLSVRLTGVNPLMFNALAFIRLNRLKSLRLLGFVPQQSRTLISAPILCQLTHLNLRLTAHSKYDDLSGFLLGQHLLEHVSIDEDEGLVGGHTLVEALHPSASSLRSLIYCVTEPYDTGYLSALLRRSTGMKRLSISGDVHLSFLEDENAVPNLGHLQLYKNPNLSSALLCGFIGRRIATLREVDVLGIEISDSAVDWIRSISTIQFNFLPLYGVWNRRR